jgi:hypothetical protein
MAMAEWRVGDEARKQWIRDKKEAWKQVCADFDAQKASVKCDGIKWTGGTRPLLGALHDEGDDTKDHFAVKSPTLLHVELCMYFTSFLCNYFWETLYTHFEPKIIFYFAFFI